MRSTLKNTAAFAVGVAAPLLIVCAVLSLLWSSQFQQFVLHLEQPFRTIALLCVSFGLRISEALALNWADVDWLNSRLRVERGIVCQVVDDVKSTAGFLRCD